MHVKLKYLACVMAVIMALSAVTCFANQESTGYDLTISELYINKDTGVVTVNGKVSGNKTKVTMVAYLPDGDGNAAVGIPTELTIKDTVYAIDEAQTDENGEFGFTFTITEDSPAGEYKIVLGVKGMTFLQEKREGVITFMNAQEKAGVIAAFNAASTDTAMATFFEENGELFDLPDFYDDTYDAEEIAFNKIVIEYRNTYYSTGAKLMTDIEKIISVSEEINKIPSLTLGTLDGFLTRNKGLLKIDVATPEYIAHKSIIQNTLFGFINASEPVKSWSKLSKKFTETVILTAFNNSDRSQTDALLKKYHAVINVDVNGDYKNVDSVEMGKALVGKNFTTLAQIKTAFENKLEELINEDGGSGGGIGSGIGSGSTNRVYNVGGTGEGSFGGGGATGGAQTGFTDLGNAMWASEAINALKNRGIIAGMTPTQFCPQNLVTREQFVKMAVAAFGAQWGGSTNSFSDVSADAWYAPYISKAVGAGIIQGQDSAFFGIGSEITRQDVAVILYRIMKDRISSSSTPAFKDYDAVSSYAKEAVCAMYSSSILSGDDKGYFNPAKACTRAEAAKMIYGALNTMEMGV